MKKVSVIVPVYNCEIYLKDCIDSILNQTYENIEVLLIDDGSTDCSPQICDNYAYNEKVRVFHNKNQGVSKTRNLGIEKAKGDYLAFVDSDDVINRNMIKDMVNILENDDCQLAVCNYELWYKNKKILNEYNCSSKFDSLTAKKEIFKGDSIRGFSCNKLFITSILKENNIHFNKDIKICEDLLLCFEYINQIEHVGVVNESHYKYRMRKSSASNYNNEKDLTVFDALNEMYKIDKNVYEYCYEFYMYLYFKYYKLLKKNKKSIYKQISILELIFYPGMGFMRKVKLLSYVILPNSIKQIIKNKKQKALQYFE